MIKWMFCSFFVSLSKVRLENDQRETHGSFARCSGEPSPLRSPNSPDVKDHSRLSLTKTVCPETGCWMTSLVELGALFFPLILGVNLIHCISWQLCLFKVAFNFSTNFIVLEDDWIYFLGFGYIAICYLWAIFMKANMYAVSFHLVLSRLKSSSNVFHEINKKMFY